MDELLPLLYDVPTVGRLLGGISRRSVFRLMGSGELPTRKLGGRVFVRRVDLERFVDELPPGAPLVPVVTPVVTLVPAGGDEG